MPDFNFAKVLREMDQVNKATHIPQQQRDIMLAQLQRKLKHMTDEAARESEQAIKDAIAIAKK